jgi:MYXO-CTERM domain-containing protein
MKLNLLILTSLAFVGSVNAGITLNMTLGTALTAGGVAVPDGTLYALVIDTDNSGTFAGGIGANQSMTSQTSADAFFTTGQSVSLGSLLGGDTVFALGGFNGTANGSTDGFIFDTLNLELGVNGVAIGKQTALYYFPGVTYSATGSNRVGLQVGGMTSDAQSGTFSQSMVMPAEGTTDYGAITLSSQGTTPNFRALTLTSVPEPSSAFLAALGVLGLLRRRRN